MRKLVSCIIGLFILFFTLFAYALDYSDVIQYQQKNVIIYILDKPDVITIEGYLVRIVPSYEVHQYSPQMIIYSNDYLLVRTFSKTVLIPLNNVIGIEPKFVEDKNETCI